MCLHWGMGTKDAENIDDFVSLFGGCHGGPDRRYKVVEVTTQLKTPNHAILRGVEPLNVHEEFYFKLKQPADRTALTPLIQVPIEDENHTVSWAWQRRDGGRSFGFTGLHFHENWRHTAYRRLIAQGTLWILGEEIPAAGIDEHLDDKVLDLPAL